MFTRLAPRGAAPGDAGGEIRTREVIDTSGFQSRRLAELGYAGTPGFRPGVPARRGACWPKVRNDRMCNPDPVLLTLPTDEVRRQPTAIDLFSGAGGITLGLEWAGYDLRLAVDSDSRKASWLAYNHPGLAVLGKEGSNGDLRRLNGADLLRAAALRRGELDLLVGCPPCQGYSLLGNRELGDSRNYLYRHFLRLVKDIRPRAVGFENVPGMISIGSGRFVADLVGSLEELGYEVSVAVANAARFGVPQGRERLFALGWLDEVPALPAGSDVVPQSGPAIEDLPTRGLIPGEEESLPAVYPTKPTCEFARTMRGDRNEVKNCEVTRHAPALRLRFESLGPGGFDEKTHHRRIDPRAPAPTLTAGTPDRTACRPIHPTENRVLTVREAARLTSFPDWYAFPRQIAEAWCHIGNSVPPLMARDVFRPLWEGLAAT